MFLAYLEFLMYEEVVWEPKGTFPPCSWSRPIFQVLFGLAKNFFCFLVFSCMMALLVLSRLTPFETIFVRLNCDSSHISMHFFKVKKLVNFCVVILILKMEESIYFQHIMLYYFKKGIKTQLKWKKKDLLQCMEIYSKYRLKKKGILVPAVPCSLLI